jgi:hypothetical protein
VAPLAATFAATMALGVGMAIARAGRERRSTRQRRRDRRLGPARRERLPHALQRMALGQVDSTLELLVAERSGAHEKTVHETRKALKRLRALLRLLERELGERTFARENAALRDIAQRLAEARDAAVMLATLDSLIARDPGKLARRSGVLALRARLRAEQARVERLTLSDDAARLTLISELRGFRARAADWRLTESDGMEMVEVDLRRLYRHGRKRYRRVLRGKGDEMTLMHEWRKRVKDLRYAAEMLDRRGSRNRAGADEHLRGLARSADSLGELLGEDHDLAVLAQHLRAGRHAGRHASWHTGRRTRKRLLKAIARRRRALRKQALREGGRLYRQRPKRFVRRVRAAYDSSARRVS